MATHSSILAWKISWTEEPGGLQSMASQRVRHNWATNTYLLGVYFETLGTLGNQTHTGYFSGDPGKWISSVVPAFLVPASRCPGFLSMSVPWLPQSSEASGRGLAIPLIIPFPTSRRQHTFISFNRFS